MSDEPTDPMAVNTTPTPEAVGEPVVAVDEAATPSPAQGATTTNAVRRTLKLGLTLQPREAAGYRVLVALGANGCDPVLHCLEAEDLPAAVRALPALLEQAERRWQTQPRYPSAVKGQAATDAPEVRADAQPVAPPTPAAVPGSTPTPLVSPPSPPQSDPAPEPVPSDQLSLFG